MGETSEPDRCFCCEAPVGYVLGSAILSCLNCSHCSMDGNKKGDTCPNKGK